MSITVPTFLTTALAEIRVARAGDVVNPDDMDLALTIFNELLDALNANGRAAYTHTFNDYTLTPNLSPHTIGTGGTFNTTTRPEEVLDAALNLGGSPNVFRPIDVHNDSQWYSDQSTPGQATSIPTDVYYMKAWPLGKLYFVPVPTTAYSVRLWTRVLLASLTLADSFDLPAGYQQAVRLTLAELLAPAFGQTVSQSTAKNARDARALVWGSNDVIPNLVTRDAGMPGGRCCGFDYRTGSIK